MNNNQRNYKHNLSWKPNYPVPPPAPRFVPFKYSSVGSVTQIDNECGVVNEEVFFLLPVCHGPLPGLCTRVMFEAHPGTSSLRPQCSWIATRIEVMTPPPPSWHADAHEQQQHNDNGQAQNKSRSTTPPPPPPVLNSSPDSGSSQQEPKAMKIRLPYFNNATRTFDREPTKSLSSSGMSEVPTSTSVMVRPIENRMNVSKHNTTPTTGGIKPITINEREFCRTKPYPERAARIPNTSTATNTSNATRIANRRIQGKTKQLAFLQKNLKEKSHLFETSIQQLTDKIKSIEAKRGFSPLLKVTPASLEANPIGNTQSIPQHNSTPPLVWNGVTAPLAIEEKTDIPSTIKTPRGGKRVKMRQRLAALHRTLRDNRDLPGFNSQLLEDQIKRLAAENNAFYINKSNSNSNPYYKNKPNSKKNKGFIKPQITKLNLKTLEQCLN